MINLIQSLYEVLGLAIQANMGDVAGVGTVLFLTIASFVQLLSPSEKKEVEYIEQENVEEKTDSVQVQEEVATSVKVEKTWSERLRSGLSGSRQGVWGKLGKMFSGDALTSDQLEEIEELLYTSDIGPAMASELTEKLEEMAANKDFGEADFKVFLKDYLMSKLAPYHQNVPDELFVPHGEGKTKVIMVVGVNGAGKTTTIGKLATKLTAAGAGVVVGACDTFRAAAVDQLAVWCDRAGATMIRAKEGAGPSGVGYEALEKAINMKADYCLLDTAGRLHTKENLMDELTKSKSVLTKLDADAPHHVLLVIDAITGQNAIRQAEEFNKALSLTGLILTKCDGSSKAGSAVSIVNSLKVPVTYIGVGESVDDINRFELNEYLDALLDL